MRNGAGCVFVAFAILACGRAIDDQAPAPGSTNAGPVVSGGACTDLGAAASADDGCSSCVCGEDGWSCTDEACTPPLADSPAVSGAACTNAGASRTGDDGCSSCTCSEGSWVCTDVACPCEPGTTKSLEDSCNTCTCQSDGTWDYCADLSACTSGDACLGESPGTHGSPGSCWCGYGGTFTCSTLGYPEPQACSTGYVKSAGDGCNTCECNSGGLWVCTTEACPEPACPIPDGGQAPPCEDSSEKLVARVPGTDACCEHCSSTEGYEYYDTMEECEASKACSSGQTKIADDDCNTCTCTSEGEWQCNDEPCNTVACGGITGVTCPSDEYCTYEPGGCGIGDASAFCRQRPIECTQEEALVCGCDGQTYLNACVAAMTGTTVMEDGPCESPPE